MRVKLLCAIGAITLFCSRSTVLHGQGAPFPFAPFERVFALAQRGSVPFQNRELSFNTQFVVTNPGNADAFVELAFHPTNFASTERGFSVPAHSSALIPLPWPNGSDEVPVPPFLSGWARFRTNQPLNVEEQMTLFDPAEAGMTPSSVPLTGYPQPLLEAEFPAIFGDPRSSTGITIANPHPAPATLTVELLRRRLEGMELVASRELVLAGGVRRDFVANELFPGLDASDLRGETCTVMCNTGIVRIRAEEGSDFAVEAIDFRTSFSSVNGGNLTLLSLSPAPSFDLTGLPERTYEFNPEGWMFPVSVVRAATLRGRGLRLTLFQLELEADDLGIPNTVSVDGGTNLLVDEETGVAVATGGNRQQVVFVEQAGLLLRIDLQGTAQEIIDLPDLDAFEIAARFDYQAGFAFVPVYNHVLIDRSTGQILDRFTAITVGAPPPPPWR